MTGHTRLLTRAAALVVACVAASACGDDTMMGPDEFAVEDLAGQWTVESMMYTENSGPGTFDLVAIGGDGMLSVTPNGSFTASVLVPDAFTGIGDITLPVSGVFRLTDDEERIRIDFTPEIPPFFKAMEPGYNYTDTRLELTESNAMFDFIGDGSIVAATMRLVIVRQ